MADPASGLTEAAAVASAAGAMISAAISAFAVRQINTQLKKADRATEATVFLDIHQTWNAVYPIYRELLDGSPDMVRIGRAGAPSKFMATREWRRMRRLFAFYEYLGTCLDAGLLSEKTVFSLVAVNPKLWEKYQPLIRYLRQENPDLYRVWEGLNARRRKYLERNPQTHGA